jgi:hypothetical protein
MRYLIGREVCGHCGARQICAWSVARNERLSECDACGEIAAALVGTAYPSTMAPAVHVDIIMDVALARVRFPARPRVES